MIGGGAAPPDYRGMIFGYSIATAIPIAMIILRRGVALFGRF